MKKALTIFSIIIFLAIGCRVAKAADSVPDFPADDSGLADPDSLDYSDDTFFQDFDTSTTDTTDATLDLATTTTSTTALATTTTTALTATAQTGPLTDWMMAFLTVAVFLTFIFIDLMIKAKADDY